MVEIIITSDEVHVWKLSLSGRQSESQEVYENLLSEDEIERVEKLRFEEDRDRFISSRGHLRLLLSRYLNKKPRQIWLRYGRYGKPYLGEESNPGKISFNLSHSHDTVLYAVSKDREVGVDVEYIRPVTKADKIIERFFSEEEREFYKEAEEQDKIERFFKLWCAREAYSKAIGSGIKLPEDKIEISFVTGEYKNNQNNKGSFPAMRICELTVDPGLLAYLAVSGAEPRIIYRNINEA